MTAMMGSCRWILPIHRGDEISLITLSCCKGELHTSPAFSAGTRTREVCSAYDSSGRNATLFVTLFMEHIHTEVHLWFRLQMQFARDMALD